jgi:hypothetical protein
MPVMEVPEGVELVAAEEIHGVRVVVHPTKTAPPEKLLMAKPARRSGRKSTAVKFDAN